MRQTLHDRHLKRERRQADAWKDRAAERERAEAQRCLNEANVKLEDATRKLEEARLLSAGWTPVAPRQRTISDAYAYATSTTDSFIFASIKTWQHPTTGAQVRAFTEQWTRVSWRWRRSAQEEWWRGAADLDTAMEIAWMESADLGRFPELPPPSPVSFWELLRKKD